jgi:hypothetical protein
MQKQFKDLTLTEIYLDYVNNFLTISSMAAYYGESEYVVRWCVNKGRDYYNNYLAK